MEDKQIQIPVGWESLRLDEFFSFKYGSNLSTKLFSNSGYPVYGANGIIGYNNAFNYKECQVLISCRGENSGLINITLPKSFVTNNSIVCEPKFKLDKHFFFNLLKQIPKTSMVSGSAQPQVVIKDLSYISLFYPKSTTEQKKIAEILSKVDTAIEQTQSLIAKYQRIKTGLMQDLLTKGIDENGNIRSEETHEFKDSELGRVPKEWDCLQLIKCMDLHNNLRRPISAIEREKMKGTYPYYGATGIIDRINKYTVDGEFVLFGEDGDHFLKWNYQEQTILVNGRFNVSNHAHIVKGNDKCTTEWIHHFFMHRDITFYLTRQGAGRFKLNKEAISNLPILVPKDPKEIELISAKINSSTHIILDYQDKMDKLTSIKTGLMQDLLSGKKRVENLINEKAL